MHFSDFTYVTRGQLAEELHVTKGTIRHWEDLRGFPKPIPGSGRRSALPTTAEVAQIGRSKVHGGTAMRPEQRLSKEEAAKVSRDNCSW